MAFEGGKAEHYSLTLGSGSFIPGFEDQIVGHSAGEEFDVNVTFPTEYQAAELAGKAAVFKIKLHEVKYKELPALDDELAKDCSEYDTLDEFKASIRKNNQEQLDKQDDLAVENALVDQVIESMEGEIPQAMYDARMDEMVNDFAFRVEQQGLRLEDYLKYMGQTMEQFRASFMPQAEKQVKIRRGSGRLLPLLRTSRLPRRKFPLRSSASLTSTRWKRTRFVSWSMLTT